MMLPDLDAEAPWSASEGGGRCRILADRQVGHGLGRGLSLCSEAEVCREVQHDVALPGELASPVTVVLGHPRLLHAA